MTYEKYFKHYLAMIERQIKTRLERQHAKPLSIHKAMHYVTFTGGKRFRPILAFSACKACGGKIEKVLPAALAIELIHTYSLVHDDLPALDNDDIRRGQPTCHKKFGEANAILTGDALLTLAFEWLTEIKPATKAVAILKEIAKAAGVHGMIGGQVADLEIVKKRKTLRDHEFIHRKKTGALIQASVVAGAISAGASSQGLKRMAHYGECLGLAFQLVDDILDGDGYGQLMPIENVKEKARFLIQDAKKEAGAMKEGGDLLKMADFLELRIPFKL